MGHWVMVTSYGGDPFFGHNGAPLSQDGPKGVPTMIWPHHRRFEILVKSVDFQKWAFG